VSDQSSVSPPQDAATPRASFPLGRTLVWLGIAGASAALTLVVLRLSLRRGVAPSDETAGRIAIIGAPDGYPIQVISESRKHRSL